MNFTDNFSLTTLIAHEPIRIREESSQVGISLKIPTIRQRIFNDSLKIFISLFEQPLKWKDFVHIQGEPCTSSFDMFKIIIFELGTYQEYTGLKKAIIDSLDILFNNYSLDFKRQDLIIDNLAVVDELWEYIIYILRKSNNEEISKPISYATEEERKFFEQKAAMENKINSMKAKKGDKASDDSLFKVFILINYIFPNYDFDFLFNQTFYVIEELQKYAIKICNYQVEQIAAGNGNIKKMKFFLDN